MHKNAMQRKLLCQLESRRRFEHQVDILCFYQCRCIQLMDSSGVADRWNNEINYVGEEALLIDANDLRAYQRGKDKSSEEDVHEDYTLDFLQRCLDRVVKKQKEDSATRANEMEANWRSQ